MTDEEYRRTEKLTRISDAGAIIARIMPDDVGEKEQFERVRRGLNELAEKVYDKIRKKEGDANA